MRGGISQPKNRKIKQYRDFATRQDLSWCLSQKTKGGDKVKNVANVRNRLLARFDISDFLWD